MAGKQLIECLAKGVAPSRAPYIPLLGRAAQEMGQVSPEQFAADSQSQTRALVETATALGADAISVGIGVDPGIGVEVVGRLKPYLAGRGVVACLAGPDVAATRAYCEAGIEMLMILAADLSRRAKFRTVANTCRFYGVPVLLADTTVVDVAEVAKDLGLGGAVVARPTGGEPGIVGGGLDAASVESTDLKPPREVGFFWSFAGEVPTALTPEAMAKLGLKLTG